MKDDINIKSDDTKEGLGKCRHTLFTTESGVYAMISRSEKKEAQEFRFWITTLYFQAYTRQ